MTVGAFPKFRSRLFVFLGGVSLVAGIYSGLARIGWYVPLRSELMETVHGPLMLSGFLGTVISLERAVALRHVTAFLIPAMSGTGAFLLLFEPLYSVGQLLLLGASLGLVVLFLYLVRSHGGFHVGVMAVGAVLWLVGNYLWREGNLLYQCVPWWAGFLLLTIAGERLELSRLLSLPPTTRKVFLGSVLLFLAGLASSRFFFAEGLRASGAAMLLVAFWLLRHDMARLNLRQQGLPRFMGRTLMGGYAWLAVSGVLWLFFAARFDTGPFYDAMIHTFFLGFVFSMIFAHAPIILPPVLGFRMAFAPSFYVHVGLLHASLLLRSGGVLLASQEAQQWGALFNAFSILVFVLVSVRAVSSATPR
ncbi:MAG: hypothetical protein HY645_05050 [Acidobacteria bacterium]|nr:hypothetical protein [Acidobacteriota bacterium]